MHVVERRINRILNNMTVNSKCKEVQSLLSVLQFTSKIVFPKYPHVVFPLFSSLYITLRNRRKRTMKYSLKSVPLKLVEMLFHSEYHNHLTDAHTCVLVSHNLLQDLSLKEECWLRMKICCTESSFDATSNQGYIKDTLTEQDSCLVYAIGLSEVEESTVLCSDIMCHNLQQAKLLTDNNESFVMFERISEVCRSGNEGVYKKFVPHVATTSSIGLVPTPHEVEHNVLDNILNSYFKFPHYLAEGDIFGVDVKKYSPDVFYMPGNQNLDVLYFVVMDIDGPTYDVLHFHSLRCGYHVKKGLTTLIQSSNQQTYLPASSVCVVRNARHLTSKNYDFFVLSLWPSGLDVYYNQLMVTLQPFLLNDKKFKVKPVFLLLGPQGVGKREVVRCVSLSLGLHVWSMDCYELQGNVPGYTEGKLKLIFHQVQQYSPCILLMKNIEALCKDKDGKENSRGISAFHEEIAKLYENNHCNGRSDAFPILVIGTCNANSKTTTVITPSLARAFLHTIHFSSPDESQRSALIQWLIKKNGLQLQDDVSVTRLAGRSSGFLYADLMALISHATRNHYKYLKSLMLSHTKDEQPVVEDSEFFLRKEEFDEALDTMQSAYADAIGAPKIPAVTWSDVGGLVDLKDEILRTITLPLSHPELVASGLQRSGLLLYGPPGTGKTLLAKAVATECNLNFLSVKGPELLNKYVGQSEENVREVFQRARSASPCIIFFDELDSLAPNRGRSGDSGGVMDRVVSQLLAEMDGLQKSTQLFVIGATNRPDLIDPALLRPGRFDKLLYVGVCEDIDSKLHVLRALTRKFNLKEDVCLKAIASRLPPNLTGADLYSVCSNAWLNAVRIRVQQLKTAEDTEDSVNAPIEVGVVDFESAIDILSPSVSAKDLHYFKQIRQQMTGQH